MEAHRLVGHDAQVCVQRVPRQVHRACTAHSAAQHAAQRSAAQRSGVGCSTGHKATCGLHTPRLGGRIASERRWPGEKRHGGPAPALCSDFRPSQARPRLRAAPAAVPALSIPQLVFKLKTILISLSRCVYSPTGVLMVSSSWPWLVW